jgi:hypothetical protein
MVRKITSGTWRNRWEWNPEKNRETNLCSEKADLSEVLDACKAALTADLLPMCRGSGTMRKFNSKNDPVSWSLPPAKETTLTVKVPEGVE